MAREFATSSATLAARGNPEHIAPIVERVMAGILSQARREDRVTPSLRVLSLGAGVQSSTLYLMAIAGEFGDERPSVAIFADTQWEPRAVYDWLDELDRIGGHIIPIRRVTTGNIREAALNGSRGYRAVSLPLYVENRDGSRGIIRRQCTRDFKINPITKVVRAILGVKKGARVPKGVTVERWMGISLDEATRMKDSFEAYSVNRYPLVDRRMTRLDCEKWLAAHGYPTPPKSACIGCPFTSDMRWRELRDNNPEEWADAIAFDEAIRTGLPGLSRPAFLHDSLQPLAEVDLSTAEERGQGNLFENECEGMCGV
jgi:hypothetical protein